MNKKWLWLDLLFALTVALWAGWLIAGVPPAQAPAGGWAQKIFYIHVPSALTGYLGFFLVALFSLGVLMGDRERWDRYLCSGLEVSFLFSTLVLLTGPFWARPVWGVWWNWEPKLTTFLIMWLIYFGWFIFRGSLPEGDQKKVYSAIYALISFINVPVVMASVYFWRPEIQLHPRREEIGMDWIMQSTFYVSIVIILLIFLRLLWFRVETENLVRNAEVEFHG